MAQLSWPLEPRPSNIFKVVLSLDHFGWSPVSRPAGSSWPSDGQGRLRVRRQHAAQYPLGLQSKQADHCGPCKIGWHGAGIDRMPDTGGELKRWKGCLASVNGDDLQFLGIALDESVLAGDGAAFFQFCDSAIHLRTARSDAQRQFGLGNFKIKPVGASSNSALSGDGVAPGNNGPTALRLGATQSLQAAESASRRRPQTSVIAESANAGMDPMAARKAALGNTAACTGVIAVASAVLTPLSSAAISPKTLPSLACANDSSRPSIERTDSRTRPSRTR